ncbi:MAG TPA: hypothetical protein VF363_01545 [Candidatus Eisenbacteria bacterium]
MSGAGRAVWRARGVRRAAVTSAGTFASIAVALALLPSAGCGPKELPSRERPTYVSPDGLVRFWRLGSWGQRPRYSKPWRIEYRAGAEAWARQRHAVGWLTADYVPERSDEESATLFRLLVFTTAGYESLAAEPGLPPGTPIGAGGGRVLVASIPTLSPYREESWMAEQYDAMRPTLDTLRASAVLSGGEAGTTAAWGADTVAYSIRLPAADAPWREIRARFAPDGSATWTTTYEGKGWPIVERARWVLRNGAVTLTFGEVGRGGPLGPLTYAIADSALVPTAWPKDGWGGFGAPLLVYRPR